MSAARWGVLLALLSVSPLWAQAKKSAPAPAAPAVATQDNADLAFGAYQRGHYLTALSEATRRAEHNDAKAMTLLGELYANGLGVMHDDEKAVRWYKLATERGDREATFALAMFRIAGRGGPRDRDEAVKLFETAAKLGHAAASHNLALLYLEGQEFPQDFKRAAEFFRIAADAGNSDAQYALALMHKEGRGVPKDLTESARLLQEAALADNLDAMVEFGIAQFNGAGTSKNEVAAIKLLLKAAHLGSPLAQNRIAHILSAGRSVPANPAEAIKWHIIAKAGGAGDPALDSYAINQTPEARAEAEKAAKLWLSTVLARDP